MLWTFNKDIQTLRRNQGTLENAVHQNQVLISDPVFTYRESEVRNLKSHQELNTAKKFRPISETLDRKSCGPYYLK